MRKRKSTKDSNDPSQAEGTASDASAATDGTTAGQDAAGNKDAEQADAEPDLAQQVLDLEAKWLRSRADLDNTRRRARLDVEEARAFSGTSLLQSLLPVLDALQRALATSTADDSDPVLEGLRLTEQQFEAVLAANGVKPVAAALGSTCDPAIHRVLIEQPSEDFEPGQIVSEVMKGYTLNDRLLREAQVVVAAKPVAPAPGSPSADPS
ncbi:MAG: molecular chaperone GrpE [Pseudohongiellaceae bacterium]|jgi:molecular chaperone GrpE